MSDPTNSTGHGAPGDDDLVAALAGAQGDLDAATAEPPPMGDALTSALANLESVPARRPRRAFALVVLTSTAYAAALIYLLTIRRDAEELSSAWLGTYVIGWMLGFAGLSWIAMVPPKGQMMPRIGPALAGTLITAALFTTVGLALARTAPSSVLSPQTVKGIAVMGHGCLRWGVITALVPIALGAVLLRGVIPVGGRAIGAAMGAAGGCLGGAMLHIHCPIADALHLGLVHGGVVLAAAGLGALLLPAVAKR